MDEPKISLQNVRSPDWQLRARKIGKHSRKLDGQTFVAPRIVLPPDYNHLIDRSFYLWDADAEVEVEDFWRKTIIKGKAIILVIPEKEDIIEDLDSDFEEEDDEFDEE